MSKNMDLKWLPGYIALGITWGSSFFFIKLSLEALSPFGVALLRGALGGITLLIYSIVTKQSFAISKKALFDLLIVALLLNSIPGFLFSLAETKVSSIIAGMLNATTPLMTVLMIFLVFREQKINSNQLVGIVIGFIGIIFVSGVLSQSVTVSLQGILMLLLATLCYGIAFPYSRRKLGSSGYSSTILATYQVGFSALILTPFSFFTPVKNGNFQISSVFGILALGSLGTGFAYIWNFRNVKLAGSAIASTVTYISPVVATILGFLFLSEKISLSQVFGGVLVLISALLVQNRIKLINRQPSM
jgi:drug/metabolite transporter (DMT)-like permease